MNGLLYPPSPSHADPRKLEPSPSFKKQVSKVIVSIVLFFIVYVFLLLAAAALAAGCFYLGIVIIVAMPKLITIIAGVGLMAVGISVIFFLIKFIFAVSKNENDSRILVTEKDQPELFSFIRRLTDETKTPFPNKIYLSDAVNASVFYNSSFWSMFLPVKKNLEIGLGLINCINISELKAVIAHEFGHFSQRSMKLGSFTYNVNRVIYNMLYQNNSYTKFLNSWGQLHSLLSLFAGITVKIAEAIQWILKQMYKVVNKTYYGLSREMEFHADAVAASAAGGNNLVSALSRLEVASSCYNTALNNANELLKQNKMSENIFANQLSIFRFMAEDHKLPFKQQLPEVSVHFIESFSKSRINYKDQWASHPTLAERKAMLEQLSIDTAPDETRAWQIFAQPDLLQQKMTGHLYRSVETEQNIEKIDAGYFDVWYTKERNRHAIPDAYKGFYDSRFIDIKDWDIPALAAREPSKTFEEIFTEENSQLQSAIDTGESDLATVQAIKDKQIDVTSFDFGGIKYSAGDTGAVIQQLEQDVAAQKKQQALLDKEAFTLCCYKAGTHAVQISSRYADYRQVSNLYDEYAETANSIMNMVSPFYDQKVSIDQALAVVAALKDTHELKLKQLLKTIVDKGYITKESHEHLFGRILHFNGAYYAYFIGNEFQSAELNELCDLTVKVAGEIHAQKFNLYKNMLEVQLEAVSGTMVGEKYI